MAEQHSEEMEMQLWEYIDGLCSEADKKRIATLIAGNAAWQAKYNELNAFHQSLTYDLETEEPSMRFTQNVMDTIATKAVAPATRKYINYNVLKGIGAFFVFVMLSAIIYALANTNWRASAGNTLSDILPLDKIFNSRTFFIIAGINVVIALVFVDGVLRRRRVPEKDL